MPCQPGDCGGEGWRLSGGASKVDRGLRVILLVTIEFGFPNCWFFRNTILEHFSLLGGCHRVPLLQISRITSELKQFPRAPRHIRNGGAFPPSTLTDFSEAIRFAIVSAQASLLPSFILLVGAPPHLSLHYGNAASIDRWGFGRQ